MSGARRADAAARAAHRGDPGHTPFPAGDLDRPLATRFWRHVASHPDRTAVWGEQGPVGYAELGRRAAAIAHAVRAVPGAVPGRVGLLLDHGAATIAGILGVLTAGAAYVPLDPRYPAARLAMMSADAGAAVLLTDPAHAALARRLARPADPPPGAAAGDQEVLVLDVTALPARDRPPEPAAVPLDAPAYLLYTSGSTGVPKGVVQTQRNTLYQVRAHTDNLRIGPGDRVSVLSSFGFDMAVTDTFAAVLNGAAAVPVDLRRTGLAELAAALRERGVTIYHSTPTVYRYLLDGLGAGERLPAVRAVVLGGEPVLAADLARFRRHFGDHCVFVNGYGATEFSFAVQNHLTAADVDAGRGTGEGVVPIGYPLTGADVDIVDRRGRPVPGEAAGELVITSAHLAGYWRDPEREARRFTGPAGGGPRGYRTGDLARRLPDGRLLYLGRADGQVKIRGHRVEPGEVEAALSALPEVRRAAVAAREAPGPAGPERALVGYVVPAPGRAVDTPAVLAAVRRVLPDHAVPREIVCLDELPLSPTGKVDRAALSRLIPPRLIPPWPAPPRTGTPEARTDSPGGPGGPDGGPADGRSGGAAWVEVVAGVWARLLGRDDLPVDRNFFDLGGHSLLMGEVQRLLAAATSRRVPLAVLYAHPTIAGMAARLREAGRPEESGADAVRDRMGRRGRARGRPPER